MFTITTTVTSNASGKGQVVAKGHGKQRTISLDHSKSDEWNRATAMATLFAVLATPEQRAKVLHPSGGQRVRMAWLTPGGGKHRWTINV